MSQNPLVSVILPVYNGEKYIEEAITSALEQTYKPLEIIVIDDGSTDGTDRQLLKFKDRIILLHKKNEGVNIARNDAAKHAGGAFLAFLDADDIWLPEKISLQMDIFMRYPEVAVTASSFEEIDEQGNSLGLKPQGLGSLLDRPVDLEQILLRSDNFIALSSTVIRKSVFDALNGFFEEKPILSADYDLWIRVTEKHKFYILSEFTTKYRVLKKSLLHGTLEKEYGAQRNIIDMHRHRYTDAEYRRRISQLHYDWADSANDQGSPQAWIHWKKAVSKNLLNARFWPLGAVIAMKRILGHYSKTTQAPNADL